MAHLIEAIAADLLSGLIRACDDMPVPAGSPPVGDAVQSAASIVQAGLPAPGESLPLAAAAIGFIVAIALILLRSHHHPPHRVSMTVHTARHGRNGPQFPKARVANACSGVTVPRELQRLLSTHRGHSRLRSAFDPKQT